MEKGSRRPLRFWVSRTYAGSAGAMERSPSGEKRRRSAWWPSCTPLRAELRLRMHEPVAEVGAWLRKVVTGYHQYHAVPGNIDQLSIFGQRLRRLWWLTLRRRSQQPLKWDRVTRISTRWLPAPRVLHPYPIVHFLATHPRWEPYASTRSYGSVRGAVSE